MTEPTPTYTAVIPTKSQINPRPLDADAVTIAAEIVGSQPETVATWIRAALAGTIPLRGTYGWDAWICYRTAVKALEISHNPQVPTVPEHQDL